MYASFQQQGRCLAERRALTRGTYPLREMVVLADLRQEFALLRQQVLVVFVSTHLRAQARQTPLAPQGSLPGRKRQSQTHEFTKESVERCVHVAMSMRPPGLSTRRHSASQASLLGMCSPDSIDLANRARPVSKKCGSTGREGARKREKERERERERETCVCARTHAHIHKRGRAETHTGIPKMRAKGVCTVVTDHRRSKVLSSKGRFKASATRKSVVSVKSACALRAVAWAHCTGLSVTPVTLAPAQKKRVS